MAKRDYYDVLGVARTANTADIKAAFRKLAKQHHPDANPGSKAAEQKFKEINEAYEILKDEEKRALYDRGGHAAFENAGASPGGSDFSSSFADIFDEMFGDFRGGGRRRAGPARGSDLRYDLEISLEDAYHGKAARLRVPSWVGCETCRGSGGEAGAGPIACPNCRGQGKVRAQQGFFTIERTCSQCGGAGQVIEKPCRSCNGAGRVQRERTLSVNVPRGVEDGTRIRLAGEGEAGMRGAPPGDLYIFLSIRPHRIFQRDGADIYCRVPIPMTTAALGGVIEVPTLGGGRARVTIPTGAQSGHQFRLRGKGMPVLRSEAHGDMIIQANVETPMNLTKRHRELLQEFANEGTPKRTSPESEGFFAKVKEFWDDLRE